MSTFKKRRYVFSVDLDYKSISVLSPELNQSGSLVLFLILMLCVNVEDKLIAV